MSEEKALEDKTLADIITHCSTFAVTCIKPDPNFFVSMNDAKFLGTGGLQLKYKCLLDNRTYTVTIKEIK